MKYSTFLTVLISILTVGQFYGQRYEQDKETYRAALELFYIDKDYHTAIRACEEISTRESSFDIERLLGKAYVQIGKTTTAELALVEACETSSDDPMSWYLLGNVRVLLGKFDIAIVNYVNAIRRLEAIQDLDVQLYPFIEAKGKCYRLKGDFILAERDIRKALELGSKYAYVEMASIYLQMNDPEGLAKWLEILKSDNGYGFQQDERTEAYLELLEAYALGLSKNKSIEAIDRFLEQLEQRSTKGFSVAKYDFHYLKYKMLQQMKLEKRAYYVLKDLKKLNDSNQSIRDNLTRLRNELEIDATPPQIDIIHPQIDEYGIAVIEQGSERYALLGTISDECDFSELGVKVNGRAISTIEEDGIFTYTIELHPGDNPVVIDALDREGNSTREEFVIQFEKKQTQTIFGAPTIRPEDIPRLKQENDYHAILIAQGNYVDPDFADLNHPVEDARKFKQILTGLYGFKEENITMLENKGRSELLSALDSISSSLFKSDNLLVFYAGHGDAKRMNGEITGGYIIPSDSRHDEYHTYISSIDLFLPFKGCQSKHILFMVDACFGGSLYRSSGDLLSNQPFINSNRLNSRNLMSSGNLEEVPDRSLFIQNLFECLENSKEHVLAASAIYEYIRKNNTTRNVPQYMAIRDYGDQGGMFHFVRDVISE